MAFDPYHKWLAIPPAEQPPNHYRLLGVSLFESDQEVIDSAANRQMAYVQGAATGEHAALSQKLLNELAAARLCLLDSAKRAAYDKKLRAEQGSKEKKKSRDKGAEPIDSVPWETSAPSIARKQRPTSASQKSASSLPIFLMLVAVLAFVGVGFIFLVLQKKSQSLAVANRAVEPEKSSPQKAEATTDATTPAKPIKIDIAKPEQPSGEAAAKSSSASDAEAKKKSDPPAAKQTQSESTGEPKAVAKKAISPEFLRQFAGHLGQVSSLAFSPDGSKFVSGSMDKRVRLWDVASGQKEWETPENTGEVHSVAFNSKGTSTLAYASDKLLVIDTATGEVEKKYPVVNGKFSGFSKGAMSFAVFPWEDPGEVIDTLNGKTIWRQDGKSGAMVVAFRPEGDQVLFGWDKLRLLNVRSGVIDPEPIIDNGKSFVTALAVHPNNRLVATGSGSTSNESLGDCLVRLWELPSGKEVAKFEEHKSWVYAVAISPDGRWLASGGGGSGKDYGGYLENADKVIRIWDLSNKVLEKRLTGHTAAVRALCFSPDSKTLLSGGDNTDIRLWRVGSDAKPTPGK